MVTVRSVVSAHSSGFISAANPSICSRSELPQAVTMRVNVKRTDTRGLYMDGRIYILERKCKVSLILLDVVRELSYACGHPLLSERRSESK